MYLKKFNVDQNDNGYIEERSHFSNNLTVWDRRPSSVPNGSQTHLIHGHAGIHAQVKFKTKVKFTVTFLVLLIMNQALRDDWQLMPCHGIDRTGSKRVDNDNDYIPTDSMLKACIDIIDSSQKHTV